MPEVKQAVRHRPKTKLKEETDMPKGDGTEGHSRVSNRDPVYSRGPQNPNHPCYHVGLRVVNRP